MLRMLLGILHSLTSYCWGAVASIHPAISCMAAVPTLLLQQSFDPLLLRSSLGQVGKCFTPLPACVLDYSSISIAGEVTSPLNESGTLELAAGNGVETDGGEDTRVAELRLRGDDRVSDVVADGRVLLILDLKHGIVLECPFHDIGVWGSALVLLLGGIIGSNVA